MDPHILHNIFDTYTQGNFKKMGIFLKRTVDNLGSFPTDPMRSQWYDTLIPLQTEYSARRLNYLLAYGEYHSQTLKVNIDFSNLRSTYLADWEASVQVVYAKGTPQHKQIFPQGHDIFHNGEKDVVVDALSALDATLLTFPTLASLRGRVTPVVDQIKEDVSLQNSKKEILTEASNKLEQWRKFVSMKLYGMTGQMMDAYQADPSQISLLLDFSILRKKTSPKDEVITGFVSGGQTKNLINRKFTDKDELLIQNTGETDLGFALVSTATTPAIDTGIIVRPTEKKRVLVSELGNLNYEFLNITNLYAVGDGFYSVTVLV